MRVNHSGKGRKREKRDSDGKHTGVTRNIVSGLSPSGLSDPLPLSRQRKHPINRLIKTDREQDARAKVSARCARTDTLAEAKISAGRPVRQESFAGTSDDG